MWLVVWLVVFFSRYKDLKVFNFLSYFRWILCLEFVLVLDLIFFVLFIVSAPSMSRILLAVWYVNSLFSGEIISRLWKSFEIHGNFGNIFLMFYFYMCVFLSTITSLYHRFAILLFKKRVALFSLSGTFSMILSSMFYFWFVLKLFI